MIGTPTEKLSSSAAPRLEIPRLITTRQKQHILFPYARTCAVLSVAVGTALASGPPHGSVREGLPHTALTSGSYDGQPLVGIRMLSLLAACRTRHKPCDSLPRLCVRHECACGAFPLVDLLPSADSAANAYPPALFARFVGTTRPSDSLQTCMSTLRPLAFFNRPPTAIQCGRLQGLPVLAHGASPHA